MASLKFRHYATESALKGNSTVQNALNAFDVGTIVFIDDTQKQYIITSKSNNVVTYKIYYGKAAVVGVSRTDATLTLTLSDGSEITVTINNVEHATSADTADTAKSVAWANVTNKPNLVTTDTEQTITGTKIFNNNTTFKNETDIESLTADSLLVTGSARFTNIINGNLKGNVEGNLTGNASTATTAATATEFSTNKAVTLTGDVTGSASSKGGWSVATTIANGAVTNAKLANSKITIAGTAVSLGGSIAASTIGAALTTSAPAAYATNAGSATKAAEAEKAIKDSDGNTINTTYLKRSGGTVTGNVAFNSSVTADNITTEDLIVNGAGRFISGITGDLVGNVTGNLTGNAATATTALSCSGNSATATLANEAKNLQNTTPEMKDESFFSKVVTEDADMVSFQTLKGNSVVWNQLVQKGVQKETTNNGLTFYPQENGEVLIMGVATETSYASMGHYLGYSYKSVANHKAFVQIFGDATRTMELYVTDDLQKTTNLGIVQWGIVAAGSVLYIPKGYDCGQGVRLRFIVNDLTQMFGAGNEPSTVEEFLQRKPKVADEFAYNEGTIVNNKVEAIKTSGVNLWDEEWEVGSIKISTGEDLSAQDRIRIKGYLPVLPNTSYYCTLMNTTGGNGYFCYYDQNKNFIAYDGNSSHYEMNKVFTTPSNCYFVRFYLNVEYGNTYNHDVCINLSDPTINGKYFPYEKHELDLSWVKDIKDGEGVKLFEDGLKSAGTAFDEIAKGRAIKRVGVVNLGNLNWTPGVQTGQYQASDFKQLRPSKNKSLVCANYTTRENGSNLQNDSKDLWVWNNVGRDSGYYADVLVVKDTRYSSAQAFKQAVQGVLLYYELAEPIEVELPYGINHTLPVWKDGIMYAESSQSSTPIVCTNAYYTNIRESVKKFIGDADSIYASTSGYNAHGTWNIDISGKASSAITANSAITATSATTATTCTGNAGTATTLQNTRKINGTDFNGSADIITSKWGTARNITISDGTNSGTATSVDGSGAITLNLPGTIKANLSGNASSATKAINDGSGNTITSTYATKTERANNDITAASLTATKLTLTRATGNITANIPTWNQDTTGTAAKATADAKGNNIINTYATKAEVAALPKSMVIKGTLDATHALPTSGMTEGDTYIVGSSGKYNNIACKVGDFFVRTSNSWLRIPAGDEWEYNENTIKGIKVNNAGHADTADTAVSAGSATSDSNGNNIASTYARINKVYDDSSAYRQFLGKSGSSSDWVRTTTTGILPYTSGNSSNGHSSLGTSSWYFSKAYIQNIYGYLNGNISGSSTSCSGNSATATTATNADKLDGYHADSFLLKQRIENPETGSTQVGTTPFNVLAYKSAGYPIYDDPEFVSGVNDVHVYNNKQGGAVTMVRGRAVEDFGLVSSGNSSGYVLKFTSAGAASPGIGGFYQLFYSRANAVLIQIFRAMIPLGRSISCSSNSIGNNSSDKFITSAEGTGKWEWYARIVHCGNSGNFSAAGHIFLEGDSTSTDSPCTWYLSYCNCIDITKGNYDGLRTRYADAAVSATTAGTCSGNSATATKAGYLDTGTMTLYAHNSNEINFGGTSTSSEIHIGYRATENRPIPTKFIFGGSAGTATLTAGGFKKKDSNASYVLTGDGGHAKISGLSVNYATSSGSCSGNAATVTNGVYTNTAQTITGYKVFQGSTVKTEGDTVRIPLALTLNTFSNTGHNVAAIGFANEPRGWYKGFFGYERTGAYDAGEFVIGLNNTIDDSSATFNDIKFRFDAKGNLTATKFTGNLDGNATTSSSCSGNSATATKATQDSDGNAINTTYLKRSGGTVTGNVTFNSSVTSDSLTTEDLIVNGAARFISGLTGDLVGNVTGNLTGTASYATSAGTATTAGNANTIEGISASRLVYGSNSTKSTYITEDQLNAPLASGFYTILNTTTGSNATIPNATSVSIILHTSYSGLDNNAGFDLLINDSQTSSLHFRPATGSGKGAWKTLIDTGNIGSQSVNYATTSGACTGNAATATKLQTARTIWGQSFDGSRNISGDIINTGNIRPSATKTSDLGSNALSYRYVYTAWVGAPSNTKLFLGAANAEHLTIDTSGNVGIGTPSPTSKLHVAGTGYFTGDTSSAANIIAGGYIKGETVKISSGCTLEYDSTQKCIKFVFN